MRNLNVSESTRCTWYAKFCKKSWIKYTWFVTIRRCGKHLSRFCFFNYIHGTKNLCKILQSTSNFRTNILEIFKHASTKWQKYSIILILIHKLFHWSLQNLHISCCIEIISVTPFYASWRPEIYLSISTLQVTCSLFTDLRYKGFSILTRLRARENFRAERPMKRLHSRHSEENWRGGSRSSAGLSDKNRHRAECGHGPAKSVCERRDPRHRSRFSLQPRYKRVASFDDREKNDIVIALCPRFRYPAFCLSFVEQCCEEFASNRQVARLSRYAGKFGQHWMGKWRGKRKWVLSAEGNKRCSRGWGKRENDVCRRQ